MNDLLDFYRRALPALLILGGSIGSIILFVKNSIMYGLVLLAITVVSILILSAFKYYKDIKFWPESISLGWLWSKFKKNTTRVDIPISAFKNLVGSGAPDVYMNGTTPENSTAFLYKATSGKSYLSRDTNFAKNGGAFHKIISSNDTGCDIFNNVQEDILYTDLKNGGFFEYASLNPNHTNAMKIMMNTKTVTETTKYACKVKNNDNNFLTDWSFGFEDFLFVSVKENWHTGNAFQHDFDINNRLNTLKYCVAIVGGKAFRLSWIPNSKWTNTELHQLAMNTATITSATNYLLIHHTMKNDAYISTNGLRYAKIDLATGKETTPTIDYDYKTGIPPNL